MKITIKNFVQDLKNTSYYSYLYDNEDIIMSFVTGSRLINANDLFSDFDIIIVTRSAVNVNDTGIRFKYKDLYTVHFYYHTIDQLLANTYTLTENVLALMSIGDLDRSDLIYENPEYADFIARFFEMKMAISKIAMLKYVKNYTNVLTDVASTNLLDLQYYHKYLYKLCYCYYRIARVEQDMHILLQAKNCANEGLDSASIEKIIEILKALKIIIDYYSMEDLVAQFEQCKLSIIGDKIDE